MSLTKDILRITAKYYPLGYKQLYENLYEETIYGKKLNKRSLSATLARLKKNGLLVMKENKFIPTSEGLAHLDKVVESIKSFFNPQSVVSNREKSKKLIIIFDIPEKRRLYRDWLRSELIGFGFTLVQKSVWLGPSLPKEFIEYLNEADILKHIRFFQATEKDLI